MRWSDGVAVTAEDVRWTWLAQRHPEVAWRYAEIKKNIKNVRVLGLHHFAVEYATESPSQLAELNEGVILPRHAWSALPFAEWPRGAAWFRDHLVTNGPFELAGWESQQRIELRRNPEYFEPDRPYLSSVVLRVVPLRANRLAELEAGKADFVSQLVPAELRRLEGQPGITIRQFWHRQYDYLAWNLRRPQFAEASVRRALTQAIDRQALVDTVWDGRARIGTSPILASVWAHHPDLEPWPYDLSAARDALLTAGWQADKNGVLRRAGRPFELELLVNSANPIHVDSAVLIQTQLARVGIEVAVRRLDFHALIDRLDSGDFDGAIGSWGIDTSLDLGYAFHSRSITEGYNSGAYAEPAVDRLIEAAREETDQDARREILYRLQEILHRDQPYAFLWEPPRFDAHSTRLRGVGSNPLSSLFRLREWRVGHD